MIGIPDFGAFILRLKRTLQSAAMARQIFLMLLTVFSLGVSGSAYATLSITGVTLNGQAQNITVAPGAVIPVEISVSTNRFTNPFTESWLCTKVTSTPAGIAFQNNPQTTVIALFGATDNFNITAPAAARTYTVSFVVATNANCTSGAGAAFQRTITVVAPVDNTPPVVTSITPADANPTSAANVHWTVTFSENVTGVNASDFQLQNTGLTGTPAITSVTGSGSVYTVTASTGDPTAEGVLGLNLIDDDSIRDTSSSANRLGGTGAGNGNFTGQTYTIVRPPTVVSIARAGVSPTSAASVDWTVTFSESVKGVAPARFVLAKTGLGGTPAVTSVVDNGDGVTWTVTATTGTGSGTLGLNITAASGVDITDQAGNALTGLPETGEIYTIDPTAPSECFIDSFTRANGAPGADWSVGHESGTFGDPRIVSNRFRLTDASTQASTYATLQRIFPGAGNKIVVEFNHYAYGGNGADGIAMVLSDASKLPAAGAFGGSLGYAPKTVAGGGEIDHAGFAGGWLGVALDEFGNFSNNTEGRTGGVGQRADSIAIRGSGSGSTGYAYLAGSATLNPGIDTTSTTAGPGYRYRITVDHSDSIHAYTKVERDTTGSGTNYATVIAQFDAKAATGQAAVPTNWSLSFTGSTGSNTNIHEFSQLQVCSVSQERLHHIELDHPSNTCSAAPVTVKACANADCSSLYVGKVTVNLANVTSNGTSSWSSGNLLTFFNGQTQVTLSQGSQVNASVNMSGSTATSPPATSGTLCKDSSGNTTNCVVQFSSACSFDVVEPGKLPGSPIYTKLVGIPFNLDLRPGDASGNPSPYTGNVIVALIDQSAPAGAGTCTNLNTGVTPESTSIAFNNELVKTVSFTMNKALKNVRVRVIAGSAGSALPSCSRDNFAIRPVSFRLTTPGMNDCSTSTSCGSSYVAGVPFTVVATPTQAPTTTWTPASALPPIPITNPTGYSGTPTFDKTKVQDHTGANLTSLDALAGSFNVADGNGITSGNFQYDDAGSIVFLAGRIINGVYVSGAVNDTGFTLVDQTTNQAGNVLHDSRGDCIPGSATNTMTGGKYGCLIGNDQTQPKGEFRPDHYAVTASITPACVSTLPAKSFTYMDQPMTVTLTANALSKGEVILSRYTPVSSNNQSSLFPTAVPLSVAGSDTDGSDRTSRLLPVPPALPIAGLPAPVWTAGQYTGSGSYTFTRLTSPDGSFENFKLGVNINDSRGALITSFNSASITGVTQVFSSPTIIRFGRLKLLNVNGAPQNSLSVPMRVEYWNGTQGFVTNTDDSCTTFQTTNISVNPTDTTTVNKISKGVGSIVLSKPATSGKTSINVCVDLDSAVGTPRDASCSATKANLPWLQGAWKGTAFDDDPTARATFGVFKSGPVIYLRELY